MDKFVKVTATFDCDGNLTPENIIWSEQKNYPISRVTDIRYTTSPENQKAEIRYTCIIHGKEKFLFFEGNRWFVKCTR